MKQVFSIYENTDVFGSKDKFDDASHRLDTMLQILSTLKLKKGSKILDVGCGTGYLAWMIQVQYPQYKLWGVDVSRKAIKEGKKKYPGIELSVSNTENPLPFEDNMFDLIISGEHVAHIMNTDLYFSEITRTLRKNGTLMITTPNLVSWLNRILILFGKAPMFSEPLLNTSIPVAKILGVSLPGENMAPSGHLRLFNLDILHKVLRHYDLKPIRSYGVSSLNNPVIKWLDVLLTRIPDLSSGIIVVAKKGKRP